MKNLMCIAAVVVFFIQTAFLPASHCRVILLTDANFIVETCRKTPNPTVCLSSLKSDPRSAHSDIYGLAVIMIDVVKAKSTATQSKIKEVLKQHRGDKSLKDCAYSYRAVVEDDIPEAYEAIKLSRSMFALESMNDVVIEANSCTRAVSHFPPLPHLNKAVADVASVASAIIDAFP